MTLEELEKALPKIREKASVSYPWLSLNGLKYETINKIHNGGNYKLRSLYRYLDLLAYVLRIDGQLAEDLQTFGQIMREKRIAAGLTVVDICSQAHCTAKAIYDLEGGKGSQRSTLLSFISCIGGVSFSIHEMVDEL